MIVFFQVESNKTIEKSIYALGVLIRSRHLKNKNIRPYNPKDYELVNEWDLDIWIKVTWGTDDIKEDEIYEMEFENVLKHGTPYFDYLLSQAVKNNRPAWSIFGLIGMMQGSLNQNAFLLSFRL